MKMLLFILIFSLATGCRTAKSGPETSPRTRTSLPQPTGVQNFDYYLLNLSWSPEFCYSHPSAAECGRHATFVLHGLWPQNSDGTYPHDCSSQPGPANPAEYRDIYPDRSLLEHEWRAHGTCSGLSPDSFLQTARAAFQSFRVPAKLAQLQSQVSMQPDKIMALVQQSNPALPEQSLALSCGNNYLTAVEVCLDKQLHATACRLIRSCGARTVRIPPP